MWWGGRKQVGTRAMDSAGGGKGVRDGDGTQMSMRDGDDTKLSPMVQEQLHKWLGRARWQVLENKRAQAQRNSSKVQMLTPDSIMRARWDFINVALLGWTVFDVPYATLFAEASLCEFDGRTSFNVAVDVFFLCDILVSFNTKCYAYGGADAGVLIEDRREVAIHYLKSWFFVDLSTSLPLSPVICLCTGGQGDLNASRIIKIMRLLKIARFIKFLKIIKRWSDLTGSRRLQKYLSLFKLISTLLCSTHIAACVWMGATYLTMQCFPADISLDGSCECQQGKGDSEREHLPYCKNWMSSYDLEVS